MYSKVYLYSNFGVMLIDFYQIIGRSAILLEGVCKYSNRDKLLNC